ncbi:MAG: type II secretion system protein, partial [Gemmatimonadota bacterium]
MGLLELILVIAVVGGIVAVLLPTFRGAAADARSDEARRARGPVAEAVRALEERRRAVIESLSEIEADRDAGNLSQPDYERQRRRYEREAAAVLLELEAAQRSTGVAVADREAQVPAQRGRGRIPAGLGWALAGIGFASLALVILSGSLGTRGEGEVMTGTVPGSGAQEQTRQRGALVPIDTARLAALERMVAEDSSNVESLVELSDLY